MLNKPVICSVTPCTVVSDSGAPVSGVQVACGKCGCKAKQAGQNSNAVKRCCRELSQRCPRGERNEYKTNNHAEN